MFRTGGCYTVIMIKVLLFDLSNTILFAKDTSYIGGLNSLHNKLLNQNPNFDFLAHFELDHKLLELLKAMKNSYQLVLFTSETIQNDPSIHPALASVFDPIISAQELGLEKTDPVAYTFVSRLLKIAPNEMLFVDDNPKNISAAEETGVMTHRYQEFDTLRLLLQNLQSI